MLDGETPQGPDAVRGPELVRRRTAVGGLEVHGVGTFGAAAGRPTFVLIHGLGLSSRSLLPLAARLARVASVYAPDLPGFGISSRPRRALDIAELADAVAAWMRANAIERAVLVGHSLGSQVAVEAALRHPELVAKIVLVGPVVEPGWRDWLRLCFRLLLDATREPPGFILVAVGDYLTAGLLRIAATLRHVLRYEIEKRLAAVAAPVLVMRGASDPIAQQGWAERAARLPARGRVVVIADSAHGVVYTAPEAVADEVLRFDAE